MNVDLSLIGLEHMLDGDRHTIKEVAEYLQNLKIPIPPDLANKIGAFFDPDRQARPGPKTKGKKSIVIKDMIVSDFYFRCYNSEKENQKERMRISYDICDNWGISKRYFDNYLAEFNEKVFDFYRIILEKGLTKEQAIEIITDREEISEKDLIKIIDRYSSN